MDEKRQNPRVPVFLDVRWESAAGKYEARTSDLSLGGCFINSSGEVTVGEMIRFTILLPGDEAIELQGQVRWKKPESGFGVKFENLSNESQEQVAALVKARQ